MWRNWSEEWERRKSYLVGSLFENIPTLSPIAEINEPRSDILSPVECFTRAYSPLPELIVEREKSLHDETDEYYRTLEIKMIKLYKKLFHGIEIASDADSSIETYKWIECEREVSDENDLSVTNDDQNVCDEEATQFDLDEDSLSSNSDNTNTSESNDELDLLDKTFGETQNFNGSVDEEFSALCTHEIIVTTAIVHRELAPDGREDINNNSINEQRVLSPTYTDRSLILVPSQKLDIFSEKKAERSTDSVGLVHTQARTVQDILKNVEDEIEEDQIETMRLGADETRSIGSIVEEQMPSKESLTPTAVVMSDMSLIRSGTLSETRTGLDSSEDLNALVRPLSNSNFSTKRTGSSICPTKRESPVKRKRYETQAVQTSTYNEEMIWEDVRDSFFRGTPLIYNLCHCRDHKCS